MSTPTASASPTCRFSRPCRNSRAEEGARQILARIPKEDWAADLETVARGQLGFTQQRRGLLPEAIANLEAGRRLPAGRIGIIDSNLGFGSDLAICILLTGDVDRGLEGLREIEARAEAGGHPPTIAFCLPNAMRVGMFLEDHAMVEQATKKVGALAELLASANVAAYSDLGLGWLRAIRGDGDGIVQMTKGRDELSRSGYLTYQAYYALQAAAAQLGLGQLDAARRHLDESDELMADTGTRWCEAEVWRMRGEVAVAAARGRANDEAERCFRKAAEVAAAQSARWWELRACFSLARMLPAAAGEAEALPRLRSLASQVRGGETLAPLCEIRGFLAA